MEESWLTVLLSGLETICKYNLRTAVILAGGKSSRMKADKALLSFGSFSSLAEFQYQRLKPLFSRVYIASKIKKFPFQAPLLLERDERFSPLVALASIWENIKVDEVFVLSVDTPFVSLDIIETLCHLASKSKADVIVSSSSRGLEPLCAIYRRSSYGAIKELLKEDSHKLHRLLERLDTEEMFFEEEKLFMNLNSPNDYQEALEYLQKSV